MWGKMWDDKLQLQMHFFHDSTLSTGFNLAAPIQFRKSFHQTPKRVAPAHLVFVQAKIGGSTESKSVSSKSCLNFSSLLSMSAIMLGEARQEIAIVLVRLLSPFWPQKARRDAEKFGLVSSASFCVFLWHHFRVLV